MTLESITFRPMTAADGGRVPIGHQREPDEVRRRIAELGSSALLAFDGARHVSMALSLRLRAASHVVWIAILSTKKQDVGERNG